MSYQFIITAGSIVCRCKIHIIILDWNKEYTCPECQAEYKLSHKVQGDGTVNTWSVEMTKEGRPL